MTTILVSLALFALALELYLVITTWGIATKLRNAGLIDPVWAFSFIPVLGLYVFFSHARDLRVFAFAALVALWSLRLSFHLFRRWWREWPLEDSRYARLRQDWGPRANLRFLRFYVLQGGVAVLLSLPWLAVICDGGDVLSLWQWLGLGLGVCAIGGEWLADHQLARFRSGSIPSGKTLDTGLWRYSRHPNYFFEWLTWCAFAVYASASPWGWTAWLSAAAMLAFLLRVTGVTITENEMKKRRGAEYEGYLRRTSAFVPLPPRRP